MLKKTIASGKVEPINKRSDFSVGTKFKLDNHLWTVTKSDYSDNTEMRTVVAEDGSVEIMTLKTLQKDMKDASFEFLPEAS